MAGRGGTIKWHGGQRNHRKTKRQRQVRGEPGTASSARAPAGQFEFRQGKRIDLNGDGYRETVGYDTTGDGRVDALDTAGDGRIDAFVVRDEQRQPQQQDYRDSAPLTADGRGDDNRPCSPRGARHTSFGGDRRGAGMFSFSDDSGVAAAGRNDPASFSFDTHSTPRPGARSNRSAALPVTAQDDRALPA